MKARVAVVAILMLAVLAGIVAFRWTRHTSHEPTAWLISEFNLTPEQAQRAGQLHDDYGTSCAEMCRRIAATDDRLQTLVKASGSVTPEIAAAITDTDRLRTECRVAMLKHFYEIAAMMPSDQRNRYLEAVLPAVLYPGEMKHASTAH